MRLIHRKYLDAAVHVREVNTCSIRGKNQAGVAQLTCFIGGQNVAGDWVRLCFGVLLGRKRDALYNPAACRVHAYNLSRFARGNQDLPIRAQRQCLWPQARQIDRQPGGCENLAGRCDVAVVPCRADMLARALCGAGSGIPRTAASERARTKKRRQSDGEKM